MLVILTNEENDMQDSEKPSPATSKRTPWNKGKFDRSQAAAAAEARLVDPH